MIKVNCCTFMIMLFALMSTSCKGVFTDENQSVDQRKNTSTKEIVPNDTIEPDSKETPANLNLAFDALNTAIGEFELQIQTEMESADIVWEIKQDDSECNGFEIANGSGKTIIASNISVDVNNIYICIYSKQNKSAVTISAVEVSINHDMKIQFSDTGSGPLIGAHSFENTALGLSLAILHKGKSIEIHRAYEESIGGVLTPKLGLINRVYLGEYYTRSVKYGDHLILYSAERIDIIKNIATTEDYDPISLVNSELFIHHGFIKNNSFVTLTVGYGLRVYDLTNLDAVVKVHDSHLADSAIRMAVTGNYLYTSDSTNISIYNISDLTNITFKGSFVTTSMFSDGIGRPMNFIVDTHDDDSVLYAHHPRSTKFYSIHILNSGDPQVSFYGIAGYYTSSVPLGIRGLTILPNNKFIIETMNKLPTGDANRLLWNTTTVTTIEGEKQTVGTSLNYLAKTNDLAITNCHPVLFSGNPHNICSHIGSTYSVLNTNDLGATVRETYENVIFKEHGAPAYVDIKKGESGMKYKALFNHEVNLLSIYKSSSDKSKPDDLYHASYNSSAFTIDGFGYGRSINELIVYTPYNSPNKFHLINVVDASSSDYVGIPADQNCNDRTFELTGGKNIFIHGEFVLAADDKTIYFYQLEDNGTSILYDDSFKCIDYFSLESSVIKVYNQPEKVVYKVNGGLYVFDKDDLSKGPTLIPLLADVVGLAISGNTLYTQDTLSLAAIKVYDVSSPSEPKLLFTDSSFIYINSLLANGDYLLVHDVKSREVSIKKVNSTKTGLASFSSVGIPSDQLKNYSTLSPVALDNEIIFPTYDFGYLKFVTD